MPMPPTPSPPASNAAPTGALQSAGLHRPPDLSIEHWWHRVPHRQWPQQADRLSAIGPALPPLLHASRPLSEVHRLDLALFVVFEEVALRVSGALARRAPTQGTLTFAAQQTIDEAQHYESFLRRSDQSRALVDLPPGQVEDAILTPPLRRFIDHCYEVADGGTFLEGLTLTNLLLEGMAYPLYAYEERYWRPVDPHLAQLVRGAFVDETRHVTYGAHLVRTLLADDPAARGRIATLCQQARLALREVFHYYVRVFVRLFDVVARRHADLFADAEIAPGRRIADTPYADQVALIQSSIDREHARLLDAAGLTP